jgi:uncharacterized membrane protein YqjE
VTDPKNNQPLGQSIGDIIDRTTTIVHEEIELAKTEIAVSLQNLLRGSVAGIVGGVFAFFGLFILLIGLSFFIGDAIGTWYPWLGFFIVAIALFIFGGLLAWFALKKIKKGSQIVPTQAVEEAKQTKAALSSDAVTPVQHFEGVAVEESTGSTGNFAAQPSAPPGPVAEAKEDLKEARVEADAAEVDAKELKKIAKQEAKEAKEAAKAAEKAEQESAKAEAIAAKAAAKAEAEAAKAAEKAEKEAQKAAKKAAKKGDAPAEAPAEAQAPPPVSSPRVVPPPAAPQAPPAPPQAAPPAQPPAQPPQAPPPGPPAPPNAGPAQPPRDTSKPYDPKRDK